MRTYFSGSFGRLRKHEQSCATVCKCAVLLAEGDIKYCHAIQCILANNSNPSSHFVTHSQLIVPLRLSFIILNFRSKFAVIDKFTQFARMRYMDSPMCEGGFRALISHRRLY